MSENNSTELTFASWLRNFRETRNIGLNQFAAQTGLSNATISKVESSENIPSPGTVKKIAARWKQNEDWLLELAGHRTSKPKDNKYLNDPELMTLLSQENLARLTARERRMLKDMLRHIFDDTDH